MQREVVLVAEERRSERTGRTKAERELRELQLRASQLASQAGLDSPPLLDGNSDAGGRPPLDLLQIAFPLRPVGLLRSCFSRRNGTPRQPLLVPSARARLELRPDLSPDFLDGLAQYSHVWLLYVFHLNTDLQRLWQPPDAKASGVRAKIRVPRLDGDKLGVFATRSPHRPCPIGLSVARVIAVEGRTLVLGGADVVDGTPLLDIKPYAPFSDALPEASAPGWVAARTAGGGGEPLELAGVEVPAPADAALAAAWEARAARAGGSLYASYAAYRQLVLDVLARDVRSVTQRVKVPARAAAGLGSLALAGDGGSGAAAAEQQQQQAAADNSSESSEAVLAEGYWHVELDGIDISYEVLDNGMVQLRTARLAAGNSKT